jgi:hypothetical protein
MIEQLICSIIGKSEFVFAFLKTTAIVIQGCNLISDAAKEDPKRMLEKEIFDPLRSVH